MIFDLIPITFRTVRFMKFFLFLLLSLTLFYNLDAHQILIDKARQLDDK
jgi:hypothetical protein